MYLFDSDELADVTMKGTRSLSGLDGASDVIEPQASVFFFPNLILNSMKS